MSDARTGHIELAAHASALAEAVRAGRTVPAGRLLGLPELPGGDYWARHGGRDCADRHSAEDHHQLACSRRAGTQSVPGSAALPLSPLLARDRHRIVAGQGDRRGTPATGPRPDQVNPRPRRTYRRHSGLAGRTP